MLNVNSVNKKTLFQIDTGDNFCTSEFQYCIAGMYNHQKDIKNYDPNSKVKLFDNFNFFLIYQNKKHNKLLDEIEFSGIFGTVEKVAVSHFLLLTFQVKVLRT